MYVHNFCMFNLYFYCEISCDGHLKEIQLLPLIYVKNVIHIIKTALPASMLAIKKKLTKHISHVVYF
jgi:hypothetical protein